MTADGSDDDSTYSLKRRTALKAAGFAGVGLTSMSGVASARGGPPGRSCEGCPDKLDDVDFEAKYKFECVEYDNDECVSWDFVFEKGDDVVDIEYEFDDHNFNKGDEDDFEEAEPNFIEFEADGYLIQSVCVYGGRDNDYDDEEDGLTEFASDLENPGGQEAAISNVVFCGIEEPEPDPALAITADCEPSEALADGWSEITVTGTVTHDGEAVESEIDVTIDPVDGDFELVPDEATQEMSSGETEISWTVTTKEAQSLTFELTADDEFDQSETDECTATFTELPTCPMYGTTMADPTEIHAIAADPDADPGEETIVQETVGEIGDMSPGSLAKPNGIAFDNENDVWYFAEDVDDEDNGVLFTMSWDESAGEAEPIVEYENIAGGNGISGAAFREESGEYLFIEDGGNELRTVTVDVEGEVIESGPDTVAEITVASNIGLGDLAIDQENDVIYVSTFESDPDQMFFSIDLTDPSNQEIIQQGGDPEEFAVDKQIAFDGDGNLWAHDAWEGYWWTVNVTDGELNEDEPVAQTPTVPEGEDGHPAGYSDLAKCGFPAGIESIGDFRD